MHRPLRPPASPLRAVPPQPAWPSFTGTGTYAGTSPSGKVNVWYDASLGTMVLVNARALVADADRVVSLDTSFFGTPDGPVNVILFALGGATDGTGGADHDGCDFQTGADIEVCVAYGRNDRVSALFEAELSECQMRGQLCGLSTGEALSRWCANTVAPHALDDFTSTPSWQQAGYPNWVDSTKPSDQDYPSIGCGMAFLSWLVLLGYPLTRIAPVMVSLGDAGTLSQLWQRLTGLADSPWTQFLAAARALGNLTSDDPFAGHVPPSPPPPVPVPTPTAPLFTLSVARPIRQGHTVTFQAPVAIPVGIYGWTPAAAQTLPHAIPESLALTIPHGLTPGQWADIVAVIAVAIAKALGG